MGNKLYVAGVGPGAAEFILPAVKRLVESSDAIIGGKRIVELFDLTGKEVLTIGSSIDEICSYIRENIDKKSIVVLASGDTGIFSITGSLVKKLKGVEMEVLPGISSLQYICSRLKTSWDDMHIISLHGKVLPDFAAQVRRNARTAVFTGGGIKAQDACRILLDEGLSRLTVSVGENLSYENERIVTGGLDEIADMEFENLSVMIIHNSSPDSGVNGRWAYKAPGIPDTMFLRGSVPMTKEEVRAVSISKLRPEEDSVVLDIGAGTGSVSVECALACKNGLVYAVEKNPEGVRLIRENAKYFGLNNIKTIEGEAPSVLEGLAEPDRIFIGGTGGSMGEIFEWIQCLKKPARIVVNAVTLESAYEALKGCEDKNFENMEIVSVSVSRSRKAGNKNLMEAMNTVYVISADKK
jgi:precorrin-6Y C5,15-methyltransferase (decarboxylating)